MNLSGLRRVSEKILPDIKRILERIIPGKANENSKKNKPNILLLSQVKGSSLAGAVMALKMGADVNYVDKETGKTALHFAVANNALPIIELLIRNKARVDIAEKEKSFTQLMMATEANYQRAILIMIESPFSGLAKKDRLGRNLINLALEKGKEKVAQFYLEKGVSCQDAAMWAIENNNAQQSDWCLAHGASLNSLLPSGLSPLIRAILEKNRHDVIYYLEKGADPNWSGGSSEFVSTRGKTPLMVALETVGAEEIVLDLLNGPKLDLEALDLLGETALMKAVRKFQVQAASIMLQQGANHLIVSNEGINLLIAATQSGRMEMVKAVYELGGFNVSDVDNRGWNALMHSAQKGDPESVNFLLSCGADPSYRSPNLNITALDLATGVRRKAYKETPEMVSTYDKIIELLSREKVA